MNNTKIELKDLVWKEIDKDKLKAIAREKFYSEFKERSKNKIVYTDFLDFYCPMLRKELDEINNKQEQYTKDDIIEMFVEVGFHHHSGECYRYEFDTTNIVLVLTIKEDYLCFHIEGDICESYNSCESINIDFNDRKRIEFYYNKFREILQFEVAND